MCAKGNLLAGLKASSPFGRCPTLYPGSSAAAIYIDYEKTLGTRSRSDQVSFKVTLEQYAKGNTITFGRSVSRFALLARFEMEGLLAGEITRLKS